jgi:hypothetical protein
LLLLLLLLVQRGVSNNAQLAVKEILAYSGSRCCDLWDCQRTFRSLHGDWGWNGTTASWLLSVILLLVLNESSFTVLPWYYTKLKTSEISWVTKSAFRAVWIKSGNKMEISHSLFCYYAHFPCRILNWCNLMPSQLPIPGIIKKKITELYSFHTVFHAG